MVALSYKVFKEKLLSGEKDQTIRKQNLVREEQMKRLGLQIYWKQRTKECEKLFDAKLKENIFPIKLYPKMHFKKIFLSDKRMFLTDRETLFTGIIIGIVGILFVVYAVKIVKRDFGGGYESLKISSRNRNIYGYCTLLFLYKFLYKKEKEE